MKNRILAIFGIALILFSLGCSTKGAGPNAAAKVSRAQAGGTAESNVGGKYTLLVKGEKVEVVLNDSLAAKALDGAMPKTLKFEPFNENEKISYLPKKLEGVGKGGYAPKVGDLCYYIPWGNLCIFTKEIPFSNDLIGLGKVTSGMEVISKQTETFEAQVEKSRSRILVAYFTWADNTKVDNPDKVDVDATTSASVLPPGNVGRIAGWICERTGADEFKIVVKDLYSSDYDTCLKRADVEKKENARPALKEKVPHIEDYDVIFLGFPNWWSSLPQAMYTFMDENSLKGKTVIPFCGHGTGGFGVTLDELEAYLPKDAKLGKSIGIYRPETEKSKPKIDKWLEELGY